MKKIEKKIKESIIVNNLSFYENLPKPVPRKKDSFYLLPILMFCSLFLICIIPAQDYNKKTLLSDQIVINEIDLLANYTLSNVTNMKELQDRIYAPETASIEEINEYYQISLKENNVKKHYFEKYKDNIIQTIVSYELDDKTLYLIISKKNPIFEDNTYLFEHLLKQKPSLILNKTVFIIKNNINNSYMIAYKANDVNCLIYTDMEEQDVIKFLKERIL